jgi:hypothetical protein
MDENELNKRLEAFAEREKILNRIELRASANGVEEPYLDDVRNHFERRSRDGEDLSTRSVSDHLEQLRTDKPRYFKAPARTSPTEKDGKQKGVDDSGVIDYMKPEHDAAFRRKMKSYGVKL